MEKERPSYKWTSDEKISFVRFQLIQRTILRKLQREGGTKKAFSSELFDSIIVEFKGDFENAQFNEKIKKL